MNKQNISEIVAEKYKKYHEDLEKADALSIIYGMFGNFLKKPTDEHLAEIATYYKSMKSYYSKEEKDNIMYIYKEAKGLIS